MPPPKPLLAVVAAAGLFGLAGYGWSVHSRRVVCGEALANLRAIADGAIVHYWDTPEGSDIPRRRLPPAVGPTPAGWPGCDIDRAPPATRWAHPTWRALRFAPRGRVHYRYAFTPAPAEAPPGFTVRATGDLDCDGVASTFEQAVVFGAEPYEARLLPRREIEPDE